MNINTFVKSVKTGEFKFNNIPPYDFRIQHDRAQIIEKLKEGSFINSPAFVTFALYLAGMSGEKCHNVYTGLKDLVYTGKISTDLSFLEGTGVGIFRLTCAEFHLHGAVTDIVLPAITFDDGSTWSFVAWNGTFCKVEPQKVVSRLYHHTLSQLVQRGDTYYKHDLRQWGVYIIKEGQFQLHKECVYLADTRTMQEITSEAIRIKNDTQTGSKVIAVSKHNMTETINLILSLNQEIAQLTADH